MTDQALGKPSSLSAAFRSLPPQHPYPIHRTRPALGLIKSCPSLYQYTMIGSCVCQGESIHFAVKAHQPCKTAISPVPGIDTMKAIHSRRHQVGSKDA